MKLSFFGTGYVGQVNAVGSAYNGHTVLLVDIIKEKVDAINAGKPTIHEKGLEDMLRTFVLDKKTLTATTDVSQAIRETEVTFICVGTPDKGEMIDLSYIRQVAKDIGQALKEKTSFHVIVVKSTVIPGTTLQVVKPLIEEYSGKKVGKDFGLAMSPEFLREGVALEDCLHPDSIVIGTEDDWTKNILTEVYHWAPFDTITYVNITAAETIKYAKNTFLALKITFANEWANFCSKIGVDVKEIMQAIGKDPRIGSLFLRSGPGYGGSCFPKDLNAILNASIINQAPFQLLDAVVKVNSRQYLQLIKLAEKICGILDGKRVGILGLSFKPDTDDTRESPALKLISYLDVRGCHIKAYCPQGMIMAKEWLEKNRINITYAKSAKTCVQDVDLVFVPTDWKEFVPIITAMKIPTFVGHRDLIEPSNYPHIYTIGYPK